VSQTDPGSCLNFCLPMRNGPGGTGLLNISGLPMAPLLWMERRPSFLLETKAQRG
jgi:hypothetical protein